jgi:pimeloyl-ACP methyl ester carboxylesterase
MGTRIGVGFREALRRRGLLTVPPAGRVVDLPAGSTYVTETPAPYPGAPTVVLLHGLASTAALCWAPTIGPLSEQARVVTFDMRWHGQGIRSDRFQLDDCADDVVAVLDALGIESAIIAGYSLGGAIAQLVWRRHPARVTGLVLASTARNYQGKARERLFFWCFDRAMGQLAGFSSERVRRLQEQSSTLAPDPDDELSWARSQARSTSGWALPHAVNALGQFDSSAWIGEVDVPTAVVITGRDRAIPTRRQRALAAAIPRAVVLEAPGGHTSVVLDSPRWIPVFLEAVSAVADGQPVK